MTSLGENSFKEFDKRTDRAKYYEERQNYQQALKEYASAFFHWRFAWKTLQGMYEYSTSEEKLDFLFALGVLINSVAICYYRINQTRKSSFFVEILKEVIEILGRNKGNFEVEQIETYDILAASSAIRGIITQNEKLTPEDLADETFKEIRDNFNEICELERCLLPPRSSGSGGCFIATAAYSTFTHPDLDTFRDFRDQKLLTNSVGKQLVSFYYRISPSIAQYLEQQTTIKVFVKQQLGYLARWMRRKGITRI